jgi:anti-anti-sigma factor
VFSAPPGDPFEVVIAAVVLEAARAVNADRAALWIARDDMLQVVATTGLRPTTVDRFNRLPAWLGTPAERLLRDRQTVTWQSYAEARALFPRVGVDQFGSGVAVPIGTDGGVLFVGWTRAHHALDRNQIVFLETVARCSALAIERSDADRPELTHQSPDELWNADLFSVWTTKGDAEAIALVRGEIDAYTAETFGAHLRQLLEHTTSRVVIDLTSTTFMDGAAVGAIAGIARAGILRGREVRIRGASPLHQTLLTMFGLDALLLLDE